MILKFVIHQKSLVRTKKLHKNFDCSKLNIRLGLIFHKQKIFKYTPDYSSQLEGKKEAIWFCYRYIL